MLPVMAGQLAVDLRGCTTSPHGDRWCTSFPDADLYWLAWCALAATGALSLRKGSTPRWLAVVVALAVAVIGLFPWLAGTPLVGISAMGGVVFVGAVGVAAATSRGVALRVAFGMLGLAAVLMLARGLVLGLNPIQVGAGWLVMPYTAALVACLLFSWESTRKGPRTAYMGTPRLPAS